MEFPCSQCAYVGTQKRNLSRHIRNRHKVTPEVPLNEPVDDEVSTEESDTEEEDDVGNPPTRGEPTARGVWGDEIPPAEEERQMKLQAARDKAAKMREAKVRKAAERQQQQNDHVVTDDRVVAQQTQLRAHPPAREEPLAGGGVPLLDIGKPIDYRLHPDDKQWVKTKLKKYVDHAVVSMATITPPPTPEKPSNGNDFINLCKGRVSARVNEEMLNMVVSQIGGYR